MALLSGKLEGELDIKSPAPLFHDVFSNRPHHVSNITPGHIQGCEIHEGDWGKAGAIINWNYVHDGVESVAKELIEEIDDVNNSTTFKVIEGHLLDVYKTFRLIVKATPKVGGGSLVHWTLEYEKLNAGIPDPNTLLEFCLNVSKDIDGHLQEQLAAEALFNKLEGELDIKSEAHLFHDVFSNRPHHVSNITPGHIQGCEIHEGDWGKAGAIINWNYVHDGVESVAKELIEEIDDVNNSTTFKVIEGHLLDVYKTFRLIVKATPKAEGGSLVHWTLEFEKLNADTPDPNSLLEFCINVSKDIDGHLQEQLAAEAVTTSAADPITA